MPALDLQVMAEVRFTCGHGASAHEARHGPIDFASAVRIVLHLPPDQMRTAKIKTESGVYRIEAIEAVYRNPDFPRW